MKNKNFFWIVFGIILALGIFLRAYHFSDWLHFELDQSRDAKVVGLAVEQGIGNLPLLGPKAAGSFLRLGPAFYYLEYLSAVIFGNDPAGIAMISLILSCASLGIFYLLVNRYFSRKISLFLLLLFSISLFMIMYSRFAWNPNNLPFFIMLLLYALLRSTDAEEKNKGWWLVLASVAFAFASHLHFVAFMSLPVISLVYLAVKRPKIALKYWLISVACLVFFYIPSIVNDIKTGGDNISEFKKVFIKKSTSGEGEHTLLEKVIKSAQESSLGYFVISTGYQKAELPNVRQEEAFKVDLICDKKCKTYFPLGFLAAIIFVLGAVFLVWNFSKAKAGIRKDFLMLIGIWFFITAGIFVPISYDLAPRFFLLIAPLPFIFLGLFFEFFDRKKLSIISYVFLVGLVAVNTYSVQKRFFELANADSKSFEIDSDKILKERDRVTLGQQIKIADYIKKIYDENNYPVYLNSEAFYRRALLYNIEQKGMVRDDFRNTGKTVYAKGNYFLVYTSGGDLSKKTDAYVDRYDIIEVVNFGTLDLVRLAPKPEAVNAQEQVFGPEKKPTSASGVPVRCRWNEVFGKCNTDGTEEDDSDSP